MLRSWRSWTLPALVLSLLVSCEPGAAPLREAPTVPSLARQSSSLTRIEGRIPADIKDLSLSSLIGVDGGSIHLAGHTLRVPAGAVTQPTLFTMTLATNGYVEVELSAVVSDLLGGTIDVGASGFAKKVPLSLTYSWASNVSDPAKLVVARVRDDGSLEPLKSRVDTTGQTVTAELDHFSRYCLASN